MSYTPDGAQSAPARVVPLPFAGGGNNTPSASRSPPRLGQSSRSGSRSLSMASKALLRSMDPSSGTSKQRRKLGIQDELRQQVDGVVKRRSGGVLGRGYILKTDHYPTGRALDLDIEVQGAPNFRAPDQDECNIFGVAQPTVPGLKSILTILRCQPTPVPTKFRRASSSLAARSGGVRMGPPLSKTVSQSAVSVDSEGEEKEEEGKVVWFSTREETLVYCNGRPYVLRDASAPLQTLTLSNRAPNLEDIERRLKQDILEEARRYGGMILFHDEDEKGHLVPTWMSVDETSIRTPREVWENEKAKGWRVEYHRIPIAPDTPIEDNYLDAYVAVLKNVDPLNTALVFNCGMGVVRTTFAMVAASLMRRQQLLLRGFDDPFTQDVLPSGISTPNGVVVDQQATQSLELATQQQALNKSLLQMTRVLDRNLPSRQGNAVDLLTTYPNLLEQLRKAHMGSYQIVLALISSLDGGKRIKALVDEIIDSCDAVVNLREHVLEYRIKYSVAATDDKARQALLEKASRSLEQYFDLIVFAAYVAEEEAGSTGTTFSAWLQQRPEIWKYVTHVTSPSNARTLKVNMQVQVANQDSQIKIIRRQGGNRLFAFAPANDLSLISRSSDGLDGRDGAYGNRAKDGDVQGAQILGDEWAEHVVTNRAGIMLRSSTLLKSDQWLVEVASSAEGVRGAIGFRQIPGSSVFTTGQPTQDAAKTILGKIQEKCPGINQVAWICLREEPLVMINGWPYCLRRDGTALRNMRDYTGVSAGRLEMLEDRLKSDVVTELQQFQGKLLLHTETSDGQVVPIWESVDKQDIESVREVMDELADDAAVDLRFYRVPVTSESSPDFHDITELLDLCIRTDIDRTAFVLNDQLGRGRSSTTAVMILLIQRWLRRDRQPASAMSAPVTPTRDRSRHGMPRKMATLNSTPSKADREKESQGEKGEVQHGRAGSYRATWQIINSCLRVIKNGTEVKRAVDEAIDASAAQFNLRDTIQDFQVRAEDEKDQGKKNDYIEKGIYHLRRYYHLLIFQAYLNDRDPEEESPYSFESFVKHRPVFKTLETELEQGGLAGLAPLDRLEVADGMALPDEVTQVVANRSGVILSAQTILKSDFFSGLQKQSLPERVDGAANYRKVTMPGVANSGQGYDYVYGTGMPSGPGLRNALHQMGAGPGGERHVTWTSLREEPVLYVKARPHVLRLMDKPVTNIETTGVTAAVVERMENALKQDVLNEIRRGDGRLLLHDEVESKPGVFEIIPIWETLDEREIMTPRELYDEVMREKYQVDYLRVAITDEQAPLPASLQVILTRVVQGLRNDKDFVFNCQMGRGRTTTGMCVAALIAAIEHGTADDEAEDEEREEGESDDEDLNSDETQYLKGEYKTILQLVTVLTHGKQAKRITDQVIDSMEGVQNLRKAVYDFKLKADTASAGSSKQKAAMHQGVNYLYRYGTLIVLANFLLEKRHEGTALDNTDFPAWMQQHREIRSVLSRRELD